MAKKEIITDFWVRDLLKEAGINLEPQGSSIKEINEALKTASKSGTGKAGYPEYVGIVNNFILVIEDKTNIANHIKKAGNIIDVEVSYIKNYAVNDALFYAQHLAKNTSYKKIFAFGISSTEKNTRLVLFL